MKDSICDGKRNTILNVWDLFQYYYCPRKVYFLKVMGVPVMQRKKMIYGKAEQERERKRLLERKDVFGIPKKDVKEIINKLYLEDSSIGLCGCVDVVLKLNDGNVLPVDIKYTDFVKAYRGRKKQLTAYAMLLQSKFNRIVDKGILYFPEQNEQLVLNITDEDKNFLLEDLKTLRALIKSEKIPRKVDESKCKYCEVAKYCV